MTLQQRLELLVQLGQHLSGKDEFLEALIKRTAFNNKWFTVEQQQRMIDNIAQHFLAKEQLSAWVDTYDIPTKTEQPMRVGIVMSDDIPLAGFHDLLCVFIAGHKSTIKLAAQDKFVLPYLVKLLTQWNTDAKDYFKITPHIKGFDAIIATSGEDAMQHYINYFGKYPHIIRPKRRGVAVLTGQETRDELHALGKDIFRYFGRGNRNVAKVYVPTDYDFQPLLEALHDYREIVLHNSYKNNFDYAYALMILNKVPFKANGAIILTEQATLSSGIANLFYQYYPDQQVLTTLLQQSEEDIELVVSSTAMPSFAHTAFGHANELRLNTYAAGIDTMAFLMNL
ncbi:MAG: acyl-CoA reductase [Bacteroidota bacterium]